MATIPVTTVLCNRNPDYKQISLVLIISEQLLIFAINESSDYDLKIINKNIHRTLILIEFEENGNATIVWAGNHDDYELTFKNNRNVKKKWLRDNSWI